MRKRKPVRQKTNKKEIRIYPTKEQEKKISDVANAKGITRNEEIINRLNKSVLLDELFTHSDITPLLLKIGTAVEEVTRNNKKKYWEDISVALEVWRVWMEEYQRNLSFDNKLSNTVSITIPVPVEPKEPDEWSVWVQGKPKRARLLQAVCEASDSLCDGDLKGEYKKLCIDIAKEKSAAELRAFVEETILYQKQKERWNLTREILERLQYEVSNSLCHEIVQLLDKESEGEA